MSSFCAVEFSMFTQVSRLDQSRAELSQADKKLQGQLTRV